MKNRWNGNPTSPTQVPFVPSISEEEVKAVQTAWANAIKTISKTYLSGGVDISERNMDPVLRFCLGCMEIMRECCRATGGALKIGAEGSWN